jgi:tripartite-type tricarboxylate transporter receptor subunit TctC
MKFNVKKFLPFAGIFLLIPLLLVLFMAGPAQAKFPSKTISYIIPVSPGGGFDTASRMLIPYLRKYLPGKPNIIVRNLPGGSWRIGITKMYRSKPDGHTVCILNMPGNAVSQVLGMAKFDLNKIKWLGNISQPIYVAALSQKSEYKNLKDLQKAPVVTAGVVGLASSAGLGTVIAADRMGFKMKPIPGEGSVQAILGAIRGDFDYVQYPYTTLKKSIVDSNDLKPVWVYSKNRLPDLPNVPTIEELGYGDLLDLVTLYRPVGGPPGLPKKIHKIWSDAFWKATNDPEFQKKMKKARRNVRPMTADETEKMIKGAVIELQKYKQLLQKYIK